MLFGEQRCSLGALYKWYVRCIMACDLTRQIFSCGYTFSFPWLQVGYNLFFILNLDEKMFKEIYV